MSASSRTARRVPRTSGSAVRATAPSTARRIVAHHRGSGRARVPDERVDHPAQPDLDGQGREEADQLRRGVEHQRLRAAGRESIARPGHREPGGVDAHGVVVAQDQARRAGVQVEQHVLPVHLGQHAVAQEPDPDLDDGVHDRPEHRLRVAERRERPVPRGRGQRGERHPVRPGRGRQHAQRRGEVPGAVVELVGAVGTGEAGPGGLVGHGDARGEVRVRGQHVAQHPLAALREVQRAGPEQPGRPQRRHPERQLEVPAAAEVERPQRRRHPSLADPAVQRARRSRRRSRRRTRPAARARGRRGARGGPGSRRGRRAGPGSRRPRAGGGRTGPRPRRRRRCAPVPSARGRRHPTRTPPAPWGGRAVRAPRRAPRPRSR